MKRILILALAILTTQMVFAGVWINGLCYNLNSDGTAEVTYMNSMNSVFGNSSYVSGSLIIPSEIQSEGGGTYKVTSIGGSAFYDCSGLTSVTIPNSVTEIGGFAFMGCSGLTSVTIPNSVTSIGGNAFSRCSGLTSVTIPNSVTSIGEGAFYDCSGLTSMTIPNSVTSIGESAFSGCRGLTSVTIPNSMTSIGNYAFSRCSGLTSVTIPNSVTSIGNYAFTGCRGLTSVTIPDSVTVIGDYAFNGCSGLTSVTIPTSVTKIGLDPFIECTNLKTLVLDIIDLNNYITEGWKNLLYFGRIVNEIETRFNGAPIKNLIIPMGTERIADYVFMGSSYLESVVFPDGFKEIGNLTFKRCPNLYNFQLPSTLTAIGDQAFADCLSIYEINLPATLTFMGDECFYGCEDLEKVTLAEGITAISDYSFGYCTRLQEVILPNSVKNIGDAAFYGCKGLRKISFPENLERIGADAFNGGVKIQDLKLPKSVIEIGNNAFRGTLDVTNLKLPEGLESVGSEAFSNCGIKTLSLPQTLVFIGNRAFAGNSFTEVSIPGSMTEITYGAFNGCSNLNKVNFNSSVSSIGDYAFAGTAIRSLAIPAPVASIGSYAFSNSGIISVTFPETLTTIGQGAFEGTQMVAFEIPNSVTTIGQNAFGNLHYLKMGTGFNDFTTHFCSGTDVLEMVSATPPSLPTDRLGFTPDMVLVPEGAGPAYLANNRWKDYNIVAKNANKAVVHLNESGTLATEIRIQTGLMPGAVTNLTVMGAALNDADFAVIRSNMPACYDLDLSGVPNTVLNTGLLNGKGSLLHVSLPINLKEIGDDAFRNCYLATFDIPEGIESIGANAFLNCESMDNELVFGSSLKSIGENAFSGCRSLKSADFSSLENIDWGNSVFSNCYSLKNVMLPKKVSAIPASLFANSGLETIYIPETAMIGTNAFQDCLNLQEVEFEEGFTSLGNSLFTGCSVLSSVTLPESVKSIGAETFSGCMALQNIALPEGLNELGERTFANSGLTGVILPRSIKTIPESCFVGSSLVYVDLNGVETIESNAFSGCPNLLVVNLPKTLQAVEEGSLNSSNISAINSPTVTPAATIGNPFEMVDNVTCALSIPRPSFTQYLGAEYWGKFVSIRNSIDVSQINYDEGDEIIDDEANAEDPASELTYMDEEDYQEMLEDMEQEEDNAEPQQARRKAMRILRANGMADVNKGYGKLFNNASLFLDETAETRFFISLADDVTSFTVKYNGKDITDQVDLNTMSFVINGLPSSASLVITTKGHANPGTAGIGAVSGSEIMEDENAPYYNLNGQIVKNPTPGIYIHNGKKVVIR